MTGTKSTVLPRPRAASQPRLLRQLFRQPLPVLDELNSTVGPVCGLGFGPFRFAIVGDPSAIRELLSQPSDRFRWNHKFNVLGFVVGKRSMLVSDGADHKRRRTSVQAGFSRRRLDGWVPMIVNRTDSAIDKLIESTQPGDTVDLYPFGRTLIIDIVVRALFGDRLSAQTAEIEAGFGRAQDYLAGSLFQQLPHRVPYTARSRVRADRRGLDAIIDKQIAESRRHPLTESRDVLDDLVQSGELSDAEIRDQVVTLIGAGYDTTAAALAWILWRVTLHDGLWKRIRDEADRVIGEPTNLSADETNILPRLELANRSMRDTLRLHPTASLAPREAATDLIVGGYLIRRGTLILWSPYLAGRDATAWRDPLAFDPDRFADLSESERAVADAAWVPFGRGPRACIGFALAQMELTLIIARMAQRLDLSPTSTEVPQPFGLIANRPTGGVPMHVSPR